MSLALNLKNPKLNEIRPIGGRGSLAAGKCPGPGWTAPKFRLDREPIGRLEWNAPNQTKRRRRGRPNEHRPRRCNRRMNPNWIRKLTAEKRRKTSGRPRRKGENLRRSCQRVAPNDHPKDRRRHRHPLAQQSVGGGRNGIGVKRV
ncbi:hypothetical protein Q3G72_034993 [Acer saccharum]|nr:hypothetical protein Q3G72_034993 [Acer saccharum]